MTKRLFVFIGEGAEPSLVWAAPADAGGFVAWGRIEDAAAPPPQTEEIIAIAPGADVALHRVPLPARSQSQARAAAPFAVEDEIAEPLDRCHVAVGPRIGDGADRLVAVVSEARMAAWLAVLEAAGLSPARLTPDYALAPSGEGEAAIIDMGERVMVRLPDGGFTIERGLAPPLIEAGFTRAGVSRARVWSQAPHQLIAGLDPTAYAIDTFAAPTHDELAQLLNAGAEVEPPVDLLQGPHARRPARALIDLRAWRTAAGLAVAAAVGWLVLLGAQAFSYDRQADRAYRQSEEIFREAFPEVRRIVNPRAQMRARLAEARQGGA
ncbi:MAG: type II secretion system protein GspL, partial [Caulobacterales bacterium]|nr:type II secretion system protein GspL [Caulobacterales bacterium]